MKKTKTKILAVSLIGLSTFGSVFAEWEIIENTAIEAAQTKQEIYSITDLQALTDTNIKLQISWNLESISPLSTFNIFEDMKTKNVELSKEKNKITVELHDVVTPGVLYNVISNLDEEIMSWDFTYDWDKIEILPNAKNISSITLIDQDKIEISLTKGISDPDLTLLQDISIEDFSFSSWDINIKTFSKIKENNKYILIATLLDDSGIEIPVNNFIYDFETTTFETTEEVSSDENLKSQEEIDQEPILEDNISEEIEEVVVIENESDISTEEQQVKEQVIDELENVIEENTSEEMLDPLEEDIVENTADNIQEEVNSSEEMLSGKSELKTETETVIEENNYNSSEEAEEKTVEEVAMQATQTPDTWADTMVMFLLSLVAPLSIFKRKRK